MNTENLVVISKMLAANVTANGRLEFCANQLLATRENYKAMGMSEAPLLEANGEITFLYLDPDFNYVDKVSEINADFAAPVFECLSDGEQMVVTMAWTKGMEKYGFMGPLPTSSDHFPVAGYLALSEIKKQLGSNVRVYKKAKNDLFKAIGIFCFPKAKKPAKHAQKVYKKDLECHHRVGTFPLEGTIIQHGTQCVIDGDLHVFTDYGVSKVVDGRYGALILDTSVKIERNGKERFIHLNFCCNSKNPSNVVLNGQVEIDPATNMLKGSIFEELIYLLAHHYEDRELIECIYTGVLSMALFGGTTMSLADRWNYASAMSEEVLMSTNETTFH